MRRRRGRRTCCAAAAAAPAAASLLPLAEQREAGGMAVDEILAAHRPDLTGGEEAGDRRLRHRRARRADVVTRLLEQPHPPAVAAEQQPARGRVAELLRLQEQREIL